MLAGLGEGVMANDPAPALALRDGDREELESWLRSTSVQSRLGPDPPVQFHAVTFAQFKEVSL